MELSCFQHNNVQNTQTLSCYDEEFGNFFDMSKNLSCTGKYCYKMLYSKQYDADIEVVNLKAASLEDMKGVVEIEHMLNEELRYNFGKVLELVNKQQQIIDVIIMSIAKIDDRLIGNILGNKAISKFVGEKEFNLYAIKEPETNGSNCFGNQIFRNGRWQHLTDLTQCKNYTTPKEINLIEPIDI